MDGRSAARARSPGDGGGGPRRRARRLGGRAPPFRPEGAAVGTLPGTLIALDVLEFEPIEGVTFIQGDFREDEVLGRLHDSELAGRPVDVVLSDMAPNLSGIESSDAARIAHLVELAVEFACSHLKPQGALLAKTFHGSGYSQQVKLFKERFRVVKAIKPKASRDKSAETFLVGLGLKAPPVGGAGAKGS
ncbi:MAG: RlmE family RNA methyltransferase [Rubrivivax sp.]